MIVQQADVVATSVLYFARVRTSQPILDPNQSNQVLSFQDNIIGKHPSLTVQSSPTFGYVVIEFELLLTLTQFGARYSSHDSMLIRQSIPIKPIHESHIDSYQFISSIKSFKSRKDSYRFISSIQSTFQQFNLSSQSQSHVQE